MLQKKNKKDKTQKYFWTSDAVSTHTSHCSSLFLNAFLVHELMFVPWALIFLCWLGISSAWTPTLLKWCHQKHLKSSLVILLELVFPRNETTLTCPWWWALMSALWILADMHLADRPLSSLFPTDFVPLDDLDSVFVCSFVCGFVFCFFFLSRSNSVFRKQALIFFLSEV